MLDLVIVVGGLVVMFWGNLLTTRYIDRFLSWTERRDDARKMRDVRLERNR